MVLLWIPQWAAFHILNGVYRWVPWNFLILRCHHQLYSSTNEPSENFLRIIMYIMKCYVPTWFDVKCKEYITYGSKYLFSLVKRSQLLDESTRDIIHPVIQRNGYFAHSENILLTMLVDENINLRKLAFSRIIKARNAKNSSTRRAFKIPKMNQEAKTYCDLIEWPTVYLTENADIDFTESEYETSYWEPLLLSDYSVNDLQQIVEVGKMSEDINKLLCHNQNLERAIKLVSEASKRRCLKTDREGIVRTVIASRSNMPMFESKKDYKFRWKPAQPLKM